MYVWGKGCVVQNFFFRTSFLLCRESLLFQSSHQTAVCWKKACDDKHYCTQWTPTVYSTLKYFHFRSNISTTSAFILVWKAQWYFWAVSHPVLLFLNSTFFQSWSLLSPERASSGLSKKQLPLSLVEEVCCCLVTKLCPTLLQPHGQLLETNFHVRVSAISWWAGALSACGGPAISQLSKGIIAEGRWCGIRALSSAVMLLNQERWEPANFALVWIHREGMEGLCSWWPSEAQS